jgi:hypothetical protein
MWRRLLEQIQDDLIHSPDRPWLLSANVQDNAHVVTSTNTAQEIFRVPIPEKWENETDDLHGSRIAQQWRGLSMLVLMVNSAEEWFDQFRRLGVDILKPPKKLKKDPKVVFVPPAPVTFNVKDFKQNGQTIK